MLNKLEKIYDKLKDVYGPRHFAALLLLLVIISVVGFAIGAKYNTYIRQDPEYCNSCHLMKATFDSWRESDHKTVTCQQCHKLTVWEQDMLLVKHVVFGQSKVTQKHGKKLPWESCGDCHWEQQAQGKLPEATHGHARHNFVECFQCHPFVSHNFPFEQKSCSGCHTGRQVHGVGMEGLSCINCHIFSLKEGTEQNRVIPTRQRCMKCHKEEIENTLPAGAPMASLECFECHNPHGKIKPDDDLCKGCHAKDLKDKGHSMHMTLCKNCHIAHSWKVRDERKLCSTCHRYRDPEGVFPKR